MMCAWKWRLPWIGMVMNQLTYEVHMWWTFHGSWGSTDLSATSPHRTIPAIVGMSRGPAPRLPSRRPVLRHRWPGFMVKNLYVLLILLTKTSKQIIGTMHRNSVLISKAQHRNVFSAGSLFIISCYMHCNNYQTENLYFLLVICDVWNIVYNAIQWERERERERERENFSENVLP